MVRTQVMERDASYVDLAVGSHLPLMVQAVGPCSTAFRFSTFSPLSPGFLSSPGTPASGGRTRNAVHCSFWFNPEYRFLSYRPLV